MLGREGFYQSFVAKLRNQSSYKEEGSRTKNSQFNALCDFMKDLDAWSVQRLDTTITEGLVMTSSNVNPHVVQMNAAAIGIADFPYFKELELGFLHDLVGKRNGIGHGAIIQPPGDREFRELWTLTESLIADYCDMFVRWMQSESMKRSTSENHSLEVKGIGQ